MSDVYVGIDIHKKLCVFTELDVVGNVVGRGSFGNNVEEVCDFASRLSPMRHIVLEPVLNYLWLLDHLEPYAGSVHVATPHKVRVIAESKCKTDKYDSRVLADLLRTNYLPESWIPPVDLRMLRSIIRQRYHLVKTMVAFKNRIRHLLFLCGISLAVSDISSLKARRAISCSCIPESSSLSISQCLAMIDNLKELVGELDSRIDECGNASRMTELLRTIPGMGRLWSATVYAEVGDINRFRSRKAFASYTGLVPSVRSSGESIHHGCITRVGSRPLRHALVEVAIRATRKVPSLNRMYNRILYRSNVQKARVAVAHKLAVIIYVMLKNEEPFRLNA
jgi:transposase